MIKTGNEVFNPPSNPHENARVGTIKLLLIKSRWRFTAASAEAPQRTICFVGVLDLGCTKLHVGPNRPLEGRPYGVPYHVMLY